MGADEAHELAKIQHSITIPVSSPNNLINHCRRDAGVSFLKHATQFRQGDSPIMIIVKLHVNNKNIRTTKPMCL